MLGQHLDLTIEPQQAPEAGCRVSGGSGRSLVGMQAWFQDPQVILLSSGTDGPDLVQMPQVKDSVPQDSPLLLL